MAVVYDLCKIIELQSQEIFTLKQPLPAGGEKTAGDMIKPHAYSGKKRGEAATAFAFGQAGFPPGMPMTGNMPNGMPYAFATPAGYLPGTKRKSTKPRKPRSTAPPLPDESGRVCTACGTSQTPKWRCGMTLCNACGLRTSKTAKKANQPAVSIDPVTGQPLPAITCEVQGVSASAVPEGASVQVTALNSEAALAAAASATAAAASAAAAAQQYQQQHQQQQQAAQAAQQQAVQVDSVVSDAPATSDVMMGATEDISLNL